MEAHLIKFEIIRENSPYNKYIKWFAKTYTPEGHLLSCCGYKTEKEARQSVKPKAQIFIGNREVYSIYEELKK